jgi:hypothetical protein
MAALAMTAIAAPATAQGTRMNMDPTTVVKGSGVLPKGWTLRFDPARSRPGAPPRPAPELTAIKFESLGSALHITSGPAAIYYKDGDIGKGQFAVSATFTQKKSMAHEVFGLFIGGSNLQDSTQNYVYFVVRPSDGMAMISHRSSNAAPKAIRPYFAADGINKDDPSDGHATNALTIHVAQDTVHFIVNGKLAAAVAKSDLGGGSTDGQVGIRVNHNMDLQITGYKVTK